MIRRMWFLCFMVVWVACIPRPIAKTVFTTPLPAWQYDDLRTLDDADAPEVSQDILALYTRHSRGEAQIRLDYLDYPMQPDHDLYLFLSVKGLDNQVNSDAPRWDYLILIPAQGTPGIIDQSSGEITETKLRIERDAVNDRVIIAFDPASLSLLLSRATIWVTLTAPGETQIVDIVGPVSWAGMPPARLPVLIGFWNSFRSATPAQALRSWDGAHTGPDSARHGLKHLLSAANTTGIPVALLDLNSPLTLSALDYLGSMSFLRKLNQKEILMLPNVLLQSAPGLLGFDIPVWVSDKLLGDREIIAEKFGLQSFALSVRGSEIILYEELAELFLGGNVYAQYADSQIGKSGLSNQVKAEMVHFAIQKPQTVFFLGGDIRASYWGEPEATFKALEFIAEHPWVEPLNTADLLTRDIDFAYCQTESDTKLGTAPPIPDESPRRDSKVNWIHAEVLQALTKAPQNNLTELAWQMYAMLTAEGTEREVELRLGYLGQIGHLLAAAHWSVNPQPTSDCGQDLDWDGKEECILASEFLFAVIEPEGGGITIAAARTKYETTQFLAPTYQFVVGMSDPSTWEPDKGVAGDPAQLVAFTEPNIRWQTMDADIQNSGISYSVQGEIIKTYQITPRGLQIVFHRSDFHSFSIPIVYAPHNRFTPGWSDGWNNLLRNNAWTLWQNQNVVLKLTSNGLIIPAPFVESRDYLQQPEDPNYAYPSGHYTPFPVWLVKVEGFGPIQIELELPTP